MLNTWKPEMYFTTYCDYDISTKKKKSEAEEMGWRLAKIVYYMWFALLVWPFISTVFLNKDNVAITDKKANLAFA